MRAGRDATSAHRRPAARTATHAARNHARATTPRATAERQAYGRTVTADSAVFAGHSGYPARAPVDEYVTAPRTGVLASSV